MDIQVSKIRWMKKTTLLATLMVIPIVTFFILIYNIANVTTSFLPTIMVLVALVIIMIMAFVLLWNHNKSTSMSGNIMVVSNLISSSSSFCSAAKSIDGEDFTSLWIKYLSNAMRIIEMNNQIDNIVDITSEYIISTIIEISDIGPMHTSLMIRGFLTVSEYIEKIDGSLVTSISTALNDAYESTLSNDVYKETKKENIL